MRLMFGSSLILTSLVLTGCGGVSNSASTSEAYKTFRNAYYDISNPVLSASQVRGAIKMTYALLPADASADLRSAASDLVTTTTEADITKMSNALATASDGSVKFLPFIDATIAMSQACSAAGF